MWDYLGGLLVSALPFAQYILMGLGALCVVVMAVIKITPSKHDDEMLESVKKIPLVGDLLAYLIGKSPIKGE